MIQFMIYLLTTFGLSPGGNTHLHTNNTQNNTNNNRTTQITNKVEECGACPLFASFTLAFALQVRKKHGKTSVRARKTSVRLIKTSVKIQYAYYQNTHTLQNPHKHAHYKTPTHKHTHILQNNIKKFKSNKMQQYIKVLLFHIYTKINRFRATHRPSSGA